MMSKLFSFVVRLVVLIWKGAEQGRRVSLNLLTIFIAILIIAQLCTLAKKEDPIPSGVALVLMPGMQIVEQKEEAKPLTLIVDELGNEEKKNQGETLLKDILKSLKLAKDDPKVSILYLNLKYVNHVSLSMLQEIGKAIQDFKTSKKKVIVYAGGFNQSSYYLAAHADEVFLNPLGEVFLTGFGIYISHMKEAMDKLKINFHIFKVGKYKSAVEPLLENKMSKATKEAYSAFLESQWKTYTRDVTKLRKLPTHALDEYINNFAYGITKHNGDTAKFALSAKLIDGIKDKTEMYDYLIKKVGMDKNDKHFNGIHYLSYLKKQKKNKLSLKTDKNKIGIMVLSGAIYQGYKSKGTIGSDTTLEIIRKALKDENLKALVVRIDSPGGDGFASEIIRRELEKVQKAKIPVIISMSSMAASGGYWIAATADQIWAQESTLTGSIGVFSIYPTFEKSFKALGIHSDGVGTTNLSDAFYTSRKINPALVVYFQESSKLWYQRFVGVVAKGRKMTPKNVDKIAQGRVWTGIDAKKLGLVDKIGDLQDAIVSAAKMAKITDYDIEYLEKHLSTKQQIMKEVNDLFDTATYSFLPDEIKTLRKLKDKFPYEKVKIMAKCLECESQL